MKNRIKWLLLALTAYFLFLLATLPMATLINNVPMDDRVQLEGITGSVWQGRLESLVIPDGRISKLSWNIPFLPLFTGSLVADVRFGANHELSGHGRLGSGFSGRFAQDLSLSIPLSIVLDELTLPVPISGEGELELFLNYGKAGSPVCSEFDGQLNVLDGKIDTPAGQLILNQAKAVFTCEKGELLAKVTEQSEFLELELLVRLLGKHQYQVKGWIKPGAKMPKMMASSMNFIGERDGKGRYRVNIKDKF